MVPTAVFRARAFSGGTATMMIWAFGVLGIYFFTSLYLQGILGFSPTKAGLAFVPMALFVVLASTVAARVTSLIGGHRTVAAGDGCSWSSACCCSPGSARAPRSPR